MMRTPDFWKSYYHPLALLLWPLSLLYRAASKIRAAIARPQKLGKPVICVGNLTMGGGGKTPMTLYLVALFERHGFRPAILSRGFGGRVKIPTRVDRRFQSVKDVGDEAWMMAEEFPVYVSSNRYLSGQMALAENRDVMIKDDGFQNPNLYHDMNIIVVDGRLGLGNKRLFPAGPLREAVSAALARIDAVIVIGEAEHETVHEFIALCQKTNIGIFTAQLKAVNTRPKKVFAFCGLAYPEKFFNSLRAEGYEIIDQAVFADHHNYTDAEAEKLIERANALSVPLITTRKDIVRLQTQTEHLYCTRLSKKAEILEVALKIEQEDRLWAMLKKQC